MVSIRAKIEKNTLFGNALVRMRAKIWAQIEKNTNCGRALVTVRPKNREKHPFW